MKASCFENAFDCSDCCFEIRAIAVFGSVWDWMLSIFIFYFSAVGVGRLFENCWDCCYFSVDVANQDCFLLLRTAGVVFVVVFAPSARESCWTI